MSKYGVIVRCDGDWAGSKLFFVLSSRSFNGYCWSQLVFKDLSSRVRFRSRARHSFLLVIEYVWILFCVPTLASLRTSACFVAMILWSTNRCRENLRYLLNCFQPSLHFRRFAFTGVAGLLPQERNIFEASPIPLHFLTGHHLRPSLNFIILYA